MRPESIPLVVVALLLISAQPGTETVTTIVEGSPDIPEPSDAVIVVGGSPTIPEGSHVETSIYVIGGTAHVDGTLDGRLVQLSGNVTVGERGSVTGTYQFYGGSYDVAEGSAVQPNVVAEPLTSERSPAETVGFLLLQAVLLGSIAYVLGRRYPDLLANVGHSVTHHPAVSGSVGFLGIVTLLAIFVFMAFTIVLIPVSVLGLLGGIGVIVYAYVVVGFLLGRRIAPDRPGVGTAAGSVLFLGVTNLLNQLPVVGGLLSIGVLVVGVGAILITYFGLRRFSPPRLRPVQN